MAFLAILLLYTKIGGNLKKSIFYIDKIALVTSLIGYHLKNTILKYFLDREFLRRKLLYIKCVLDVVTSEVVTLSSKPLFLHTF